MDFLIRQIKWTYLQNRNRLTDIEDKLMVTRVERVKVKVAQSRPTLCDPMDYIVQGILQARILSR